MVENKFVHRPLYSITSQEDAHEAILPGLYDENKNIVGIVRQKFSTEESARSAVMHARERVAKALKANIVTTHELVQTSDDAFAERAPYSFDAAHVEQPLMHYTHAGNIFQILRFGIQSNNFKSRINVYRATDERAEQFAQQMNGLRVKQGGSYQNADSISLSKFSEDYYAPPNNILFLVNPAVPVIGDAAHERDAKAGYGSGITSQTVGAEYAVGNSAAYKTEVLGINAIMPKDLRAIVINKHTSLLAGIRESVMQNAMLYVQERKRNPRAAEDVTATLALLAALIGNEELQKEVKDLRVQMVDMDIRSITMAMGELQNKILQVFVGDNKLSEFSLREALQEKFHIQFLYKTD